MEWEDVLHEKLSQMGCDFYDEIYEVCLDAYDQGSLKERMLAIEAYRLRCVHLFGNRCMNQSSSDRAAKKTCDGKCIYMNKYISELYKLET